MSLDCGISGELVSAVQYIVLHPQYIMYLLAYGVVSVCGILCVFVTVVLLGSLVNSILTTTRKFITVLISIYVFNHHCTPLQYVMMIVIFATVAFNLYYEHMHEREEVEKPHSQ